MTSIFTGLFFIWLSFNINLNLFGNAISFDLLPDIVGYICLCVGLNQLKGESEFFDRLRGKIIPLIVISGLFLLAGLFGWELGILGAIFSILELVLALYATWQIVRGVEDMENRYRCDMRAGRLRKLYKRYFILDIITTAGMILLTLGVAAVYLATGMGNPALVVLLFLAFLGLAIAILVTIIQFLIAFNFARKQYEAVKAGEEPQGGYRPPEGGEAAEAADGPAPAEGEPMEGYGETMEEYGETMEGYGEPAEE